MFNKLKASLGFGAATIDTVINGQSFFQGDKISGTVYVKGGDIEQDINAIKLKLCTEAKVETDNGVHYEVMVLAQINANQPFTIGVNEAKEFNFTLPLPGETPITAIKASRNQSHVWVETELDIDFGLDAKDRDFLEIKPLAIIEHVLARFNQAGYQLAKADVEKGYLNGGHFKSTSGCYQELEFKNSSFFSSKEIELSFILQNDDIHCLVEIDRTGSRGDSYQSFSFSRFASEGEVDGLLASIL